MCKRNAASVAVPITFYEMFLFVFFDLHLTMASIRKSLSLLRHEFWKFILVREVYCHADFLQQRE